MNYGRARIALARQADADFVTIEDYGPGMPRERAEIIPSTGWRAAAPHRETGGTGLGLTVEAATRADADAHSRTPVGRQDCPDASIPMTMTPPPRLRRLIRRFGRKGQ